MFPSHPNSPLDKTISPSTVSVVVHETGLLLDHAEHMLDAGLASEARAVLVAADKLLAMTRGSYCAECGSRVDWSVFTAPEWRCRCPVLTLED